MAKVTRIAYSKKLNAAKYAALEEQARLLGRVRSEVWNRYGSVAGTGKNGWQVAKEWRAEKRNFGVLAHPWHYTLYDAMDDIKMNREAAKRKVRQAIRRHTTDNEERKRLYILLKNDGWAGDGYLRRMMRRYWRHGHNHTHNQIIASPSDYSTFQLGGRAWVKIPSLQRGKPIAIPLNTTVAPIGMLRVILRDGCVEIHYAVEAEQKNNCGTSAVGVDKGYTEVLVDSDGEHHGEGLGKQLATESDYLKAKYQRRNKIRAIAKKADGAGDHTRAERIRCNNLGRKKLDKRKRRVEKRTRDVVYKAVHAVVDKAKVIAAEDLTAPMSGRKFGKNINRRLGVWIKGIIAEALENVSQRRSSTLVLVNAAYTSQIDNRTGCLTGERKGDRFYCEDGVVLQADENAALNVLARLSDPEIGRYTPYQMVKRILLERTERHRLGLLNQATSGEPSGSAAVSELPPEHVEEQRTNWLVRTSGGDGDG